MIREYWLDIRDKKMLAEDPKDDVHILPAQQWVCFSQEDIKILRRKMLQCNLREDD